MTDAPGGASGPVHEAVFADLAVRTLYEILRLRVDVFVVEQQCAYRELDGRDTEPACRHLWVAAANGAVVAYLRMLDDTGDTTRIGRVVTARTHRGRGLADLLVRHAIARAPGPVVADAQAHLRRWYEERGFVATGPPFDDAGIRHLPMWRDVSPAAPRRPAPGARDA